MQDLSKLARFWIGLAIVGLIGVGLWGRYQQRQINRQLKVTYAKVAKAKDAYSAKRKKLRHAANLVYVKNMRAKKGIEASNANKLYLNSQLQQACDRFFGMLFTFNSNDEYVQHFHEAEKYVTPNVLKDNKALLNNGKDNTGNSIIDALQLTQWYNGSDVYGSKIDANGNIEGLVKVTYSAQEGDHTPGVSTTLYEVTYNPKVKRICQLQFVGVMSTKAVGSGDYHNELPNH